MGNGEKFVLNAYLVIRGLISLREWRGFMRDEIQKLKFVADHYGERSQLQQTQEELRELNDAIVFYLCGQRYGITIEAREKIIEEIADVENMIFQVKYLLGLDSTEINQVATAKMDRQIWRIEEGGR